MKIDISKRNQVKIGGTWHELISINRFTPTEPSIAFSSDEKHDIFYSGHTSGWPLTDDLEFREMPPNTKLKPREHRTWGRTVTR